MICKINTVCGFNFYCETDKTFFFIFSTPQLNSNTKILNFFHLTYMCVGVTASCNFSSI